MNRPDYPKYAYSTDGENFHIGYNTLAETILDAVDFGGFDTPTGELLDAATLWVARAYPLPMASFDEEDAGDAMDCMEENLEAADETWAAVDKFPPLDAGDIDILASYLTQALWQWAEDTDNMPKSFGVRHIHRLNITTRLVKNLKRTVYDKLKEQK